MATIYCIQFVKNLLKPVKSKQNGFPEVYVYSGGLFEWMLLQDIYGQDEFPTTKKVLDILKWKPASQLIRPRIGY
jgi:hypothetical protein